MKSNYIYSVLAVGVLGLSLFGAYEWLDRHQQSQALSQLVAKINLQNRFILSQPEAIKHIVPGILSASPLNTSMLSCFDGHGKDCQAFNGKESEFVDPLISQALRFKADGSVCAADEKCQVERSVSFSLSCGSNESCETVHITAVTKDLQNVALPKQTKIDFSAKESLIASTVLPPSSTNKAALEEQAKKAKGLRELFVKSKKFQNDHPGQIMQLSPDAAAELRKQAQRQKGQPSP